MPLFEVDATRPFLVQSSGNGAGGEPGVHTQAHRVVESHIDGLLGEQVFPVAQGSGPDEPHLLALDASGLPVVVELVGDLDKSTLTRALDHAGAAGRLTRGELASRYHGGQHSFAHDVAEFYDSVPITKSSSPKSGGGARLIIICQNAPQEILNAVDFLRQPTMPVEVLKMDVVKSDDGRRFLDVSPLVIHLPPGLPSPRQADRGSITRGNAPDHVTPEPVASAPMFTSRSKGADVDPFAEGVKVGYALTGKLPVVAHEARAARQASANASEPAGPPASGPTPASPSTTRGANPARGLRRSLARGGEPPSAPESAPSPDNGRPLPPSRSARRAMAERDAAAPPSGSTPMPLSPERPGPGGQVSAPTPVAPPVPPAADEPDPSVPSSDTLPRVPKPAQAPVRRRSRRDRFASAPDERPTAPTEDHTPPAGSIHPAPQVPGPAGPTSSPLFGEDVPAFTDGSFTAHSPVPPPPSHEAPAPDLPAPPADESLWQPTTYPDPGYPSGPEGFAAPPPPAAPTPVYPSFGEGHPSGSFGPIDAAPFEPPVIDSQWHDPVYPPDPGQGQETAYAGASGHEQVYDWSADPTFGPPQPGLSAQPDYPPAPDASAGYPSAASAAQPPFPGQAPEAQIPPVPTDESIRANTPGLFDEEEDPDLEALARSFGAPTRIVWSRPRRSQHHEAVLHPNGVIELADGGQYRHPDTAATAASGSYTADGWSVWRVGEQGPSLTEAFQQRFV
ncbi:hypothetical protein [Myceligenerans xiligouense]|uniref:RAMA domain-containing protein n=1 Tax=Myceligenerans xiligouense TaxID=253184 RepID=A0A3N4Z3N8_9MICO|nr:hypothetical protein [Myceligenerans xiligouense]RPF19762.1 hypothetical protein EDD34_0326 [Myceligenerans xiligouense]